MQELPEATVGVVTPYKAQADRIAGYWEHEPRVRVGTVRTFQGGERDVVVFGLVAGASMPAGSVAWLEAERNLWNVAISRARVHLVLVGDRAFWAARRGVGAELATIEAATDESAKDDLLFQRLPAWELYDRADPDIRCRLHRPPATTAASWFASSPSALPLARSCSEGDPGVVRTMHAPPLPGRLSWRRLMPGPERTHVRSSRSSRGQRNRRPRPQRLPDRPAPPPHRGVWGSLPGNIVGRRGLEPRT